MKQFYETPILPSPKNQKVVPMFNTVIHNPCHIVQPENTHHLLYLSFPSFPTESNADQDQDHTPHATGQRMRPSIRSRRSKKQIVMQSWSLAVMHLLDLLSLSLEVLRGGGGGGEIAGEDGLEEGSEDDLSATRRRVSKRSPCMKAVRKLTRSGEEPSRGQGRT